MEMSAPRGTDPDRNEDLAKLWEQVNTRVLELAGGDQKQIQPLGVKGVLAQLDRAQNKASERSEKTEGVRSAFDRTLKAIQTVGGVAAGAASQVRLHIAMVFCIGYAWQGYQAIFEELATLLSQCSEYLERLNYHISAKMDANLSRVAGQHLLLFVEICSRTVRLRSKRTKLLAFTKIFFLQEDMVADLVEKMQRLVDKENRLVGAVTLSLAAEAAEASQATLNLTQGVVDILVGEKDTASMNQLLLRTLAFDASKIDQRTQEPDALWANIHRNYVRRRVKGTGEWVFEEAQFKDWYSGAGAPILAIEGKEGSGKSHLASTIISWLMQKRGAEGSTRRMSTAFYFVEGDSREELKHATNLESVAKSLVWQFSQAERRYLKSVAGICEQLGEVDPGDISKHLLFGNEDLAQMDVTFYIVLDGLGDAVGEGMVRFLTRASKLIPGRKTRVLMTGDHRCFDQLVENKDITFDRMAIEQRSAGDVRQYINRRMDDMPALKDSGRRRGIADLRERIQNRLAEQANGDYLIIETALDTIQQCEYVAGIENALNMAGRERSEQIDAERKQLNEQLTEGEIAEVNEIVRWIVYGAERLTPSQLGTALDLRTGQPSLLPLEDKLRSKYRLFEVDGNGKVDFRSTDIESSIPKGHHSHQQQDANDNHQDQGITPGESVMVEHFLRTVCPPDVYKRLKLDAFLELKQQRRNKGVIHCDDQHTGQTLMALACLRVLGGPSEPQRNSMLPYARPNLVKHLSAVDLALAEDSALAQVGSALVKLFTHGEALDVLLANEEFIANPKVRAHVRHDWFGVEENRQQVLRWLRDSAVIAGVTNDATRDWITKVVSGEEHLMRRAAEWMARRLFQERHFKPFTRDAFFFILTYVNQDNGSPHVPWTTYIPELEEIEKVDTWCQSVLGEDVKKHSSLWHVQLGILFRLFGYKPEAESRARNALSLDANDFRASTLLAEVLDPAEGATLLESTVSGLQIGDEWMQSDFNRMEIAKLMNTLGVLYWKNNKYDQTVSVCRRALTYSFTDYHRVFDIMLRYSEQQRWASIVDMLEVIREHSTDEHNLGEHSLGEMMEVFAEQAQFHSFIFKLIQETERVDLLDELYQTAIARLDDAEKSAGLCHVRAAYGEALYGIPTRRAEAIKQWEHAVQQDIPRGNYYRFLPRLISRLGPIYVDRAERAADPSPHLEQIRSLVPDSTSETASFVSPQIYLARYWHAQGNQKRAKRMVRETVQQCIDLLCDQDEGNDEFAYMRLLSVFIPLGDNKNMMACVKTLYILEGEHGCDGDCGETWLYGDQDIWWCRDCVDVSFNAACYQKLCEGQFKFSVCHRGHEFFFLKAEEVEDDEDEESFKAWLEDIKREYLA
ncbi:hypothetical protein BDW62DRAFT_219545 [Aspergillus aurantiobrunneus]